MTDTFPARVSKSGPSKVITIPSMIADKYDIGETVQVLIKKTEKE